MTNYVYSNDLPNNLNLGLMVAIDTETMGLNPNRDRLCLVQISSGDGDAHLVQIFPDQKLPPNLCALLKNPDILKIFHFGRFDIAALYNRFNVLCNNVYCTKIASKLVRTFTDRHGLKNLLHELISIDVSKQLQSSDWGNSNLTEAQIDYAASDVLYLHKVKEELDTRLVRENRQDIAQACFDFLPKRAQLDILGWPDHDIFSHS
ncbi:MAG: ribonuclease H-like domain-containing protein [Paracoccaceae bacterium]|nr:ribonuclease H-like domain-containing protein [Paracoccaceae bacterium]